MTFDDRLDRYAELLVRHGVNLQAGQDLHIAGEACQRDFAVRVAEAAYRAGARHVDLVLNDPRVLRARVRHSRPEDLDFVPCYLPAKYDAMVDEEAATLRLVGSEDPDLLAGLDPTLLNRVRVGTVKAIARFYDVGIGQSKVHWTVAGAATPGWGRKVFPDLEPEAACRRLWEEIFSICRIDAEDPLAAWAVHNENLHRRARELDAMKVDALRFTGPGTDLTVGLSPAAHWLGGTDTGPRGVDFEPNVPTEEVFTTPDWRRTQGRVRTTRPFLISGQVVEGLEIEFADGLVTAFEAERGRETFAAYIDSDAGARRLGEVALVGTDSPVYRSGLVFGEILYDENAACHIAVGRAYKTALHGGDAMRPEDLEAVGCNDSTAHTDMMISSDEVDVVAALADGSERPLIEKGCWSI